MAKNKFKRRIFKYNRRIRGLTDYRKRLAYLKSGKVRVVVRKFNKNIVVQFVEYNKRGDFVITSAMAYNLKKYGYNLNTGNIPAAYLTGYLAGKRLLKTGFKDECIVDLGLQKVYKKGRLFAAIKGVIDAGVNVRVNFDEETINEDRIKGKHLIKEKDASKILDKVKSSIEKEKK